MSNRMPFQVPFGSELACTCFLAVYPAEYLQNGFNLCIKQRKIIAIYQVQRTLLESPHKIHLAREALGCKTYTQMQIAHDGRDVFLIALHILTRQFIVAQIALILRTDWMSKLSL